MPDLRVLCGLALVALTAGVLKGATGFGGALLMAPAFNWTMDPRRSAVLIVSIHALTSWQGVRKDAGWIRWKAVVSLCGTAIVTAALVAPWIAHADSTLTRRVAATSVVIMAGLHLGGWRWHSGDGWKPTFGVGILSGALTAACGLGGPPAAFYFAGQSQEKHFVRSNLLAYFMLLYVSTLVVFSVQGQVQSDMLVLAVLLAPLFAIGNVLGANVFRRLSVPWFDRIVGVVLVVLGVVLLVE